MLLILLQLIKKKNDVNNNKSQLFSADVLRKMKSAGVTQPFMMKMTFLFKKVTGNLIEFILQKTIVAISRKKNVDVPWKPDGILYPPIILEDILMQIEPLPA